MKHVTIEVRDGCAEIVTVPPGVTVTVRDFDVIDLDNERLERIGGKECRVFEQSGADEPPPRHAGTFEIRQCPRCGNVGDVKPILAFATHLVRVKPDGTAVLDLPEWVEHSPSTVWLFDLEEDAQCQECWHDAPLRDFIVDPRAEA